MKSLKQLNPAPDGHTHLAFIDDSKGTGISSVVGGHAHQMQWVDPVEPQTDPNTGQPVVDPMTGQPDQGQPGHWQMSPGDDGHTHEGFTDLNFPQKTLPKQDDDDVVKEVLQLFQAWYEVDRPSIDAGKESEEFYCGKQWSDTEKSTLNNQSRACLTINHTERGIDTLSGYERNQRTDIHYVPMEASDQKAADLYNILTKQLLDYCKFPSEKSESFEDCTIAGRGAWNIRVNFDNDLRGEPQVERFPWDQFCLAPHEKRDASDAEGFCKFRWYSEAKISQLWPDAADEIKNQFIVPTQLLTDIDKTQPGEQTGPFGSSNGGGVAMPFLDVERRNVLVIECHRNIYLPVPVLANAQEDFYLNAYSWPKAALAQVLTIPGFVKVERVVKKIRISKIAGTVLLSDENPADLPSDNFHFVPFYAKRRRGQFWGKVEGVKDPQREINKRASQAIDIGNRMAAYNWFYDKETFPDNELERFKDQSSTPGAAFEVNSTSRLPAKTEGTKFPSEIVQLREQAANDIDQLMNVVPDQGGANTSGSALMQREKAKMTANEYLFGSLSDAMLRLGRLLIPIIKRYYPPERILRIVRSAAAKSPQQVGGQDMGDFTDEDILTILDQADLDKFDLIVTEASNSPSSRLATYLTLSDMGAKGQYVPPQLLIKYSDMPENEKQQLLQDLQAQQDAQAQQAQTEGDSEIAKTLVAKGIIPPTVAEKFQIPPQTPPPQAQEGVGFQAPAGGLAEGQAQPEQPQQPQPPQSAPINVTVSPPAVTVINHAPERAPTRRSGRMSKSPDGSWQVDFQDGADAENQQETAQEPQPEFL